MYKMLEDLSDIIKLQLHILEKRKALTPEEIKLLNENMQEDSLIENLIPILQVMAKKEVNE
jgi:hypothetical protein